MILILLGFGVLIGLALGLTGAGGSILAVPLLIYGAGLEPLPAIHLSLMVVTITAALGAMTAMRGGAISRRAGFIFASTGMLAAPLGVQAGMLINPGILVAGFALLLIAVSISLWRKAVSTPEAARVVRADIQSAEAGNEPVCRYTPNGKLNLTAPCSFALAASGLFAGALSGLFGVGGGFVIVPILMVVTQMDIHRAVATSLMVIALIGIAGVSSVMLTANDIDWTIALPFMAGGAAGMLAGRLLASRLAGSVLQKVFALAVLMIGSVMLFRQIAGV